jgi:hypothetical protein
MKQKFCFKKPTLKLFSCNGVCVQIPAFLKSLESLQSLDLSGNRIGVLENLHLPTGMQI